jgi:FERM/RhoGEF/pleckstrin domain protein 2
MDRAMEQHESSEYSDIPDIHSSSSDNARRYPDFEEEPEDIPEDCEAYGFKIDSSFPSTSNKFETLDMSENVDEMGFPRYDRLRQVSNLPPQKPARQKKKSQPKVAYPSVHMSSGSGTETKAGLSDDVYCSSEDSFAAGFVICQTQTTSNSYKNVELPYPDFLSDYDDNDGASGSNVRKQQNDSEKSFDSDDEEMCEQRKF